MLYQMLIPLTSKTQTPDNSNSIWTTLLFMGGIFLFLYFIMIRPQKKKEKKEVAMRNSIQVGDEVVTTGGIVGIVFSIKDDTVVIETGGDRSKIRIKRFAIYSNETIHENDVK